MSTWIPQAVLMGATGPAGGVFGSAIADFGSSDNGGADAMSLTVTVAAAWVTSTSYPIVEIGPGGDHTDADDLTSEEVYALVTNIVIGVSFDIEVFAPNGTWGQWLVNWGAALTGATVPPHAASHSNGTDNVTLAESQITGLVTDLAAKAPTSRTITAGDGMTGGGDLSANRTLAVDGTVIRSTDTRLSPYNIAVNGIIPGGYNRRINYDDFLGNSTAGQLGWTPNVSGAGASVTSVSSGADSSNKATGILQGVTGSTSSGTAAIFRDFICAGLGAYEQDWRIYLNAIPSGAQTFNFRVGLLDNGFALANLLTLYISWNGSSAVMYGQAVNASAPSTSSSVASVAAGSFFKVQMVVNAAWTSVSWYVNGSLLAGCPVTTNLPAAGTLLVPAINIIKTVGTTSIAWLVDQFFDDYQYTV